MLKMVPSKEINWAGLMIYLGAALAAWTVLQQIVPEPYKTYAGTVLLAIAAFIGFILKGHREEK